MAFFRKNTLAPPGFKPDSERPKVSKLPAVPIMQDFDGPGETTMVSQPINLEPPKLDGIRFFDAKTDKLEALKKKLRSFEVIHNESGIRFGAYAGNIRGLGSISLGDAKFLLTRTRTTLVLISDRPPESIYDISPVICDVDFKRSCILRRQNGSSAKHMWLCRLTLPEVQELFRISARLSGKDSTPPPSKTESLVPKPDGGLAVNLREFKDKLAKGSIQWSTIYGLDLDKLADEVLFATKLEDDSGNLHYYLVAGDEANGYRLYVNADVPRPEAGEGVAMFLFSNNERCYLMKED